MPLNTEGNFQLHSETIATVVVVAYVVVAPGLGWLAEVVIGLTSEVSSMKKTRLAGYVA